MPPRPAPNPTPWLTPAGALILARRALAHTLALPIAVSVVAHALALAVLTAPAPPPPPSASGPSAPLVLDLNWTTGPLAEPPPQAIPDPTPEPVFEPEPAPALAAEPIAEPEPQPQPARAPLPAPTLAELIETIAESLPSPEPRAPASIPSPTRPTESAEPRRVVLVLDAAGSTAPVFAAITHHAERLLDRLEPTDRFAIHLARSAPGAHDASGLAFAGGALLPVSEATIQSARGWLRSQRPFGAADPLAGLAPALRHRPDAVIYLARSIPRTPDALAPVPRDHTDLLAELDRLNPRRPDTGQRDSVIHAVQFAHDDPTGLMQAIAHDHGAGPSSYRVLRVAPARDRPAPALP